MIKCKHCSKELTDRFKINIIDNTFFCDQCYEQKMKELKTLRTF